MRRFASLFQHKNAATVPLNRVFDTERFTGCDDNGGGEGISQFYPSTFSQVHVATFRTQLLTAVTVK